MMAGLVSLNIAAYQMHFAQYSNKKASEGCIEALHRTCGGQVALGDVISYCKSLFLTSSFYSIYIFFVFIQL